MFVNIITGEEDNKMLDEIIEKIGKVDYERIKVDVDKACDDCKVGQAISLVSVFTSDWSGKSMQKVYDALGDEYKAALYAGIIFKEIVKKNKHKFKIVKSGSMNIYYREV